MIMQFKNKMKLCLHTGQSNWSSSLLKIKEKLEDFLPVVVKVGVVVVLLFAAVVVVMLLFETVVVVVLVVGAVVASCITANKLMTR